MGYDEECYRAAVERAVFFDLSAYGKIEVSGRDALSFLHNLSTNDIKNLAPGAGCEAFLCNARARTLAYLLISRLSAETPTLLLDMVPALGQKVFQHLDRYHISEQVELANRTNELALFRLVGPQAGQVLEKVLSKIVPEVPPLHSLPADISQHYLIRAQTLLGLPGYDLFCLVDAATQLRQAIAAAGAELAAAEIHESLRIEAGLPEYGKDMDDDRFVAEVGRTAQAISYTKGCYLGQEPIVMARDRGQVNRTLMGIKIAGSAGFTPLPSGTKLFLGETEVGLVTSSTWSPRLNQQIALAYVRRGSQQPGTELTIAADGRKAMVVALPFV